MTWKVHPHGPLEELEPNLLMVEGTVPGVPFGRRMLVAKLADGRVAIHSAVALGDEAMARIEALGEPAFLLVPSRYHRLDAAAFKARYPKMRGVNTGEAALCVRPAPGERLTLGFCDALFNVPHGSGFGAWMLKLVGSSGGLKVTPYAKMSIVSDKKALADHLRELAAAPGLERLVPCHGEVVAENAPTRLRAAADALATG
jgi:hypothetical protein